MLCNAMFTLAVVGRQIGAATQANKKLLTGMSIPFHSHFNMAEDKLALTVLLSWLLADVFWCSLTNQPDRIFVSCTKMSFCWIISTEAVDMGIKFTVTVTWTNTCDLLHWETSRVVDGHVSIQKLLVWFVSCHISWCEQYISVKNVDFFC